MVKIMPVRDAHLPEIHALLETGLREQESFAAACDPPEDSGFFDEEIAEHRAGLASRPQGWRVALDDDRVLGVLWLRYHSDRLGPYASVRQIVVDPEVRGRGIGTQLLRHAETEVRDSNAVMLLISALRPNPAWSLYRSLGFSDFPPEFRDDTNPEHIVLWKWLAEGGRPRGS